jgi:dihydroflavonol-4-reductase
VSRVFVTGGSGVIGTALVSRLRERGEEVVALARCERSARKLAASGAEVVHGDALDSEALERGMRGCELAFNVAGVNALCAQDAAPMQRMNAHQPAIAVHAAHRAGVRRLVHTSSAATIGEPPGCIGTEQTVHRGWYLSRYERTKTEGERAAFAAARRLGQDVVCVNPSSVQGPGRATGTARFLLALLDGRLRVFVRTNVSLVDIDDCVQGHLLAAERGTSGERYLLSGVTLTTAQAIALVREVCGVRARPWLLPRAAASAGATLIEAGFRLAGRRPPICREMVRTLLHGHRYDGSRAVRELGLRYTDPRQTLHRTALWARSEGLLRSSWTR